MSRLAVALSFLVIPSQVPDASPAPDVTSAPAAAPAPAEEPLPDGAEIHRQLIEKFGPMYEKYRGIETKDSSAWTVYDRDTGEVEEKSSVVMRYKSNFYDDLEVVEITDYIKNGEPQDPDDFPSKSDPPMVPFFDAKGAENYRLKVVDRIAMRRQPCWAIEVTALDETMQHLEGMLYVNRETLVPVFFRGGLADLLFIIDSMAFEIGYEQRGDLLVITSMLSIGEIDIPLLYPDKRIVSKNENVSATGIPK